MPAYPLKMSANRRYLEDQNGAPLLIQGDSPWSLITGIGDAEVAQYLANREAKGFNALIANLIEHKFNGPQTRSGLLPFHNPNDLSTPNDAYFDYAAWVIEQAAARGMLVFLAPLFLGFKSGRSDEGWYHEARFSGPEKLYRYGQYVGRRLARFDNIFWLIGNDRNTQGIEQEITALVQGIKSAAPNHLLSAQPAPEEVTLDWYGGHAQGGWLDLNTTYSYQIVHKRVLVDYNRKPVMPFVLIESTYEGEHNASPVQIRRQAYWAILCGACGQFMGNRPIWLFDPGWKEAMDLEGSTTMLHVKTFFTSRPWHDLVPDQKHQVVTSGLGEFNGTDYLAAALTADRSTVMAYLPTPRPVTVDLSKVSGNAACAWWFNPRNGETTPGGEYPTRGKSELIPPGEGDWGLVVDNAEQALPGPGIDG